MTGENELTNQLEAAHIEEEAKKLTQIVTENAIRSVENPSEYYDHYAVNFAISAMIDENRTQLIPLGENRNLLDMQQFRDGERQNLLIPLRPIAEDGTERQHFTGLYVTRLEEGFHATYIDPVGSGNLDHIPAEIRVALEGILQIPQAEIRSMATQIQHYNSEEDCLTNVHCGAFTAFILSSLAAENLRLRHVNRTYLEVPTEEGWERIPDLNEQQSKELGVRLRRHDAELLGGKTATISEDLFSKIIALQKDFEAMSQGFTGLAEEVAVADAKEHYQLKRSDSGMSQYSDLVDEMLEDQLGTQDAKGRYDVIDVLIPNPEIRRIDAEIAESKGRAISIGKNKKLTSQEKELQKSANRDRRDALKDRKESLPRESEIDYKEMGLGKRIMHLFRGKNLNNVIRDPETGESRERTKKEKEDYVTKKYDRQTLHSDGTHPIRHDEKKLERSEGIARAFISDVKRKVENKGLFGAGTSYSSAVDRLMQMTGLRGNPMVATSKFPWVAAEYLVGQMGGAAGGDRDTAFGYQKDGKPVNRVLGNGFVISIHLEDYKSLRDSNDLIDVNLDIVGEGIGPNKVIEEVTFASKIPAKNMRGSLPMVLPRLDREWGAMSHEKHGQYGRIFGLRKESYNYFRNLLQSEGEYPIGQLTEHLIQHHGNLLQKLAINFDRKDGYEGRFVATQNSSGKGAYHGDLENLNNGGETLRVRKARTDSAKSSSPYLTREKPVPQTPQQLHERLGNPVVETSVKGEAKEVKESVDDSVIEENPARRIDFGGRPSTSPSRRRSDENSKNSQSKGR